MQTEGGRKCELESENESASETKVCATRICIWGDERAEAGGKGVERGSPPSSEAPG